MRQVVLKFDMKQILHISLVGKRPTLLLALVSLAILALSGCSEASPAFGQFFSGRTLVISVVGIDRMSELRYTAAIEEDVPTYVRVAPSQEGLELVVVHLKVQNHTATSALLDVDRQALELEPDGTFAATKGFIRGPVQLQRGMGLDGWMVFEAPPDTKFREFKWRAGDNLTITF